jgi:hypothetical protein
MLPSPYSDYYLVSVGHRKDREGGEATSTPPETPSKSRPGRESPGPPKEGSGSARCWAAIRSRTASSFVPERSRTVFPRASSDREAEAPRRILR